jgi:hypothetical protein
MERIVTAPPWRTMIARKERAHFARLEKRPARYPRLVSPE